MRQSISSSRMAVASTLTAALLLPFAASTAESQSRAPKPQILPKATAGPGGILRPTPTPTPLPDLIPWFTFDRVQQRQRADGTPCGLWNVTTSVQNITLASVPSSFEIVLERRTGPNGTFVAACPQCTFTVVGPLPGGVAGGGEVRQFNDCGYGPPYSPDFRIRVDIHNAVKESNERNNSQVRSFPRAD